MLHLSPRSRKLAAAVGAALLVLVHSAGAAATVQRAQVTSAAMHVRNFIDARYQRSIADGSTPLVYVSNFDLGAVLAYPTNTATPPTSPIETISGLAGPGGLAVDSSGNLYVIEDSANDVKIFAPGASMPFKTLVGLPNQSLASIAVDANRTVYVSVAFGGINVYVRGATTPSYTLSDPTILNTFGLAVDGAGNVLVSFTSPNTPGIRFGAFPASTTLGARLGVNFFHALPIDAGGAPVGAIVDKYGNLIISDPAGVVKIYQPDVLTAGFSFAAGLSGAACALALTSGNHHLFAVPEFTSVIYKYSYPAGKLEQTINLPNTTPLFRYAIATSPASTLGIW